MVSELRVKAIVQDAQHKGVAFAAYTHQLKQSTIERYLREAAVKLDLIDSPVSKGLLFADVHLDATADPHRSYGLVQKFAVDFKPDWVVNLGDWMDFDYLSKFAEDDSLAREGKRLQADIDMGKADLDFWQEVTDDYTILQGNHDERLDRLIAKRPEFEYLLSADKLFGFRDRGVKYYPAREQPYKRGKLNMVHGWFANKYHAASHLDRMSGNIVYGHVHNFQSTSRTLVAVGEEIAAWSLGCLCDKAPGYLKGRPSEWQNGFAVVYMDESGAFNLYPVRIIRGSFIWGGVRYS